MSVTARDVRSCLEVPNAHFHLLGIGGVGMAGVAELLSLKGVAVSGCDLILSERTGWLESHGIRIFRGHDPAHLDRGITAVVYSSAVTESCPEILKAREMSIPVIRRGQLLAVLLDGSVSVAVAGTHGKTTTAVFTTEVLRECGGKLSWAIGSESSSLPGVAGSLASEPGVESEIIVVEADESDGSLAQYHPDIALVTNVEFDHMEHFDDQEAFERCFETFISQARRAVIYCSDDPVAARLASVGEQSGNLKLISYGVGSGADVRAHSMELQSDSSSFVVSVEGEDVGEVKLPVPGEHNVTNGCAAFAVGLEFGVEREAIIRALSRVRLPARRFEKICEKQGILVVSDYAHHPTEIAVLVKTALARQRARLLMVYQPHRYSRTRTLAAQFPESFSGLDQLVLVPVYAASEEPVDGGHIHDLYAEFRRQEGRVTPMLASSCEQAWEYLKTELNPGDMCLVTGAGDVEQIAASAREYLQDNDLASTESLAKDLRGKMSSDAVVKFDEPLGPKTTLRVGGLTDLWVEVACENDLKAAMEWSTARRLPFRIIGAGSNVLVNDLGLRGVTCRLSGTFNSIEEDSSVVRVGAGTPIPKLLNWLEERELSGLEFMEGIPGTVGGAVRMNAGAQGGEISECVRRISCLKPDGSSATVDRKDLLWEYRCCRSLEDCWVLSVDFETHPGARARIAAARKAFAERREWFRGLRCAGSVFRNPGQGMDPAGRLLDKVGLKGVRVGGAFVSDHHANVIVAEDDATASDVKALVEILRDRIRKEYDVFLELEVVELV